VGNYDGVWRWSHPGISTEEIPQNAFTNEIHIAAAFAKVVILNRVEDTLDLFDRLSESPLGVYQPIANVLCRCSNNMIVAHNELMRRDDRVVVLLALFDLLLDLLKLSTTCFDRTMEAFDLAFNFVLLEMSLGHFELTPIDDVGPANRDALASCDSGLPQFATTR
jgi:hypothetical protein